MKLKFQRVISTLCLIVMLFSSFDGIIAYAAEEAQDYWSSIETQEEVAPSDYDETDEPVTISAEEETAVPVVTAATEETEDNHIDRSSVDLDHGLHFYIRHWHSQIPIGTKFQEKSGNFVLIEGYIIKNNSQYDFFFVDNSDPNKNLVLVDENDTDYIQEMDKNKGEIILNINPVISEGEAKEEFSGYSITAGHNAVTEKDNLEGSEHPGIQINYIENISLVKAHVFYLGKPENTVLGSNKLRGSTSLDGSTEQDTQYVYTYKESEELYKEGEIVFEGDSPKAIDPTNPDNQSYEVKKAYNTSEGLHTDKTASEHLYEKTDESGEVTLESDGRTFDIELESWFNGQKPIDVAFVLDASGSMAFPTSDVTAININDSKLKLSETQKNNLLNKAVQPSESVVNWDQKFLTDQELNLVLNTKKSEYSPLGVSGNNYFVYNSKIDHLEFNPIGYWDGKDAQTIANFSPADNPITSNGTIIGTIATSFSSTNDKSTAAGWYYANSKSDWDFYTKLKTAKLFEGINLNASTTSFVDSPKYPTTGITNLEALEKAANESSNSQYTFTKTSGYRPLKFYLDNKGFLRCFGDKITDGGKISASSFVYELGDEGYIKTEALQRALGNFTTKLQEYSPESMFSAVRFSMDVTKDSNGNSYAENIQKDNLAKLVLLDWTDDSGKAQEMLNLKRGTNTTNPQDTVSPTIGDHGVNQYNYGLTGKTSTKQGLKSLYDNLINPSNSPVKKNNHNKYVIIFTDGKDTDISDQNVIDSETISAAKKLKDAGYTIYSVMLTGGPVSYDPSNINNDYGKAKNFLNTISGQGTNAPASKKNQYVYTTDDENTNSTPSEKSKVDKLVEIFTNDIFDDIIDSLKDYSVRDSIDPRFDLVDSNGNIIYLNLDGKVTYLETEYDLKVPDKVEELYNQENFILNTATDISTGVDKAYLKYDALNQSYYLEWTGQEIPSSTIGATAIEVWRSRITLRAKDDFIGGNTVLTNGNNSNMNYVYNPKDSNASSDSHSKVKKEKDGDYVSKGFPRTTVNISPVKSNAVIKDNKYLGENVTTKVQILKDLLEEIANDPSKEKNYYLDYLYRYIQKTYTSEGAVDEFLTQLIKGEAVTIPYSYIPYKENGNTVQAGTEEHENEVFGSLTFKLSDSAGYKGYPSDEKTELIDTDSRGLELNITFNPLTNSEPDDPEKGRYKELEDLIIEAEGSEDIYQWDKDYKPTVGDPLGSGDDYQTEGGRFTDIVSGALGLQMIIPQTVINRLKQVNKNSFSYSIDLYRNIKQLVGTFEITISDIGSLTVNDAGNCLVDAELSFNQAFINYYHPERFGLPVGTYILKDPKPDSDAPEDLSYGDIELSDNPVFYTQDSLKYGTGFSNANKDWVKTYLAYKDTENSSFILGYGYVQDEEIPEAINDESEEIEKSYLDYRFGVFRIPLNVDTGNLVIEKTVVTVDGEEKKDDNFIFTVTLTDGNENNLDSSIYKFEYKIFEGDQEVTETDQNGDEVPKYISSGGTLTLKDGQRAEIYDLPIGTKYTVEETDYDKDFYEPSYLNEQDTETKEGIIKSSKNDEVNLVKVSNKKFKDSVKQEITPGAEKFVSVGDTVTYQIDWQANSDDCIVKITDKLDTGVDFVLASYNDVKLSEGNSLAEDDDKSITITYDNHTVTWTIKGLNKDQSGKVELQVRVNEQAKLMWTPDKGSEAGVDYMIHNRAVVNVGDREETTETIDNPLKDKSETAINDDSRNIKVVRESDGKVVGQSVKAGDVITYTIGFSNPTKDEKPKTIVISDTISQGLEFVEAGYEAVDLKLSDVGTESTTDSNIKIEFDGNTVTWTFNEVPSQTSGEVYIKLRVTQADLNFVNNKAVIRLGEEPSVTTNKVENPLVKKKETFIDSTKEATLEKVTGTGALVYDTVDVGQKITYEIRFHNSHNEPMDITITDPLDPGVNFVSAEYDEVTIDKDHPSKEDQDKNISISYSQHEVVWEIKGVPADTSKSVTLTVEVNIKAFQEWTPFDENELGSKLDNLVKNQAKVQIKNESKKYEEPETYTDLVQNPLVTGNLAIEKTVEIEDGDVKTDDDFTFTVFFKDNLSLESLDSSIYSFEYKIFEADQEIKKTDSEGKEEKRYILPGGSLTLKDGQKAVIYEIPVKTQYEVIESDYNERYYDVTYDNETGVIESSEDQEFTLVKVTNKKYKDTKKTAKNPVEGEIVGIGETVEYKIDWQNYKDGPTEITVTDRLDDGVDFIEASFIKPETTGVSLKQEDLSGGSGHNEDVQGNYLIKYDLQSHTVTWTLKRQQKGDIGTVYLKVQVNNKARKFWDPEKESSEEKDDFRIVNQATVSYNGEIEVTDKVEHPLASKTETEINETPVQVVNEDGKVIGPVVKTGDEIRYAIHWTNTSLDTDKVVITDNIQNGLEFVSAEYADTILEAKDENPASGVNKRSPDDPTEKEERITISLQGQTVTWEIADVAPNASGEVFIVLRVTDDVAITEVINQAQVQVGGRTVLTEKVENPKIFKTETKVNDDGATLTPGEEDKNVLTGTDVELGNTVTYAIGYHNSHKTPSKIVITDPIDNGVDFVEASFQYDSTNSVNLSRNDFTGDNPEYSKSEEFGDSDSVNVTIDYDKDEQIVTWTIDKVEPEKGGVVYLTVEVNENAIFTWNPFEKTSEETSEENKTKADGRIRNQARVIIGNDPENNPTYDTNIIDNPVDVGDLIVKKTIENEVDQKGIDESAEFTFTLTLTGVSDQSQFTTHTYENDNSEPITIGSISSGDSFTLKHNQVIKILNLPVGTGYEIAEDETRAYDPVIATQSGVIKKKNETNPEINTVAFTNKKWKETEKTEKTPGEGKIVGIDETVEYEIDWQNYKDDPTDITVTDRLDDGVDFIEAGFAVPASTGVQPLEQKNLVDGSGQVADVQGNYSIQYDLQSHTITWTLRGQQKGALGKVYLKVQVNSKARLAWDPVNESGQGEDFRIVNRARVYFGNDYYEDTEIIENPIASKTETEINETPVQVVNEDGKVIGPVVKTGDEIRYAIHWTNTSLDTDKVVITDNIQNGLEFVSAEYADIILEAKDENPAFGSNKRSPDDPTEKEEKITISLQGRTVTWEIDNVAPNASGEVFIVLRVTDDVAITEVINQAQVQVGGRDVLTEKVENPKIFKTETKVNNDGAILTPGEEDKNVLTGTDVELGNTVTYAIGYHNSHKTPSKIVITDPIDNGVDFVSAVYSIGTVQVELLAEDLVNEIYSRENTPDLGEPKVSIEYHTDREEVTWTIDKVEPETGGVVYLTVEVNENAIFTWNPFEKTSEETSEENRTGTDRRIRNQAKVTIGNDPENNPTYDTNIIDNPVDVGDLIVKKTIENEVDQKGIDESAEFTFTLTLTGVSDQSQFTTHTYENDNSEPISTGSISSGESFTLKHNQVIKILNLPVGTGYEIKEDETRAYDPVIATQSGVIEKKEETNPEINTVVFTNKKWKETEKTEKTPGEGKIVGIGETVEYEIDWQNFKAGTTDITVTDRLDDGVDFIEAGFAIPDTTGVQPLEQKNLVDGSGIETDALGNYSIQYDLQSHTITWTLRGQQKGALGKVYLKVQVNSKARLAWDPEKESSEEEEDFRIVNQAQVQFGNDDKVEKTRPIENPVSSKTETEINNQGVSVVNKDGKRIGPGVKIGDEIRYAINWNNTSLEDTTVIISDEIREGLEFISAEYGNVVLKKGETLITGSFDREIEKEDSEKETWSEIVDISLEENSVKWEISNVKAGTSGTVYLILRVSQDIEKDLVDNQAEVTIGGKKVETELVENPLINKTETLVNSDEAVLDEKGLYNKVQLNDQVTYKISYYNPYLEPTTVLISDPLDPGVDFVSAEYSDEKDDDRNVLLTGSDLSSQDQSVEKSSKNLDVKISYDPQSHTVNWTIEKVPPETSEFVTLTVKVNQNARYKWAPGDSELNLEESDDLIFNRALVTINGQESYTDTVKNPIDSGELIIKKVVSGNQGDINKAFTFTVTLSQKLNGQYGELEFKDGIATTTLKHDETKRITDLPLGVEYTVEETDNEGYIVTSNNESGIIDQDPKEVLFTNYRDQNTNPEDGLSIAKFHKLSTGSTFNTLDNDVTNGQTINYLIKVYNNLSTVAENVIVEDPVPSMLHVDNTSFTGQFLRVSTGKTSTSEEDLKVLSNPETLKDNTNTIRWYLGDLEPGDEVDILFNAKAAEVENHTYWINHAYLIYSEPEMIEEKEEEPVTVAALLNMLGLKAAKAETVTGPSSVQNRTDHDPNAHAGIRTGATIYHSSEKQQGEFYRQTACVREFVVPQVETPKSPEIVKEQAVNNGNRTKELQSVNAGDIVTYYLTVNNTTGQDMTSVTITDVIPTGLSFVDGQAYTGYSYNASTRTISWMLSQIPAGGSATVWFNVQVPSTTKTINYVNQFTMNYLENPTNQPQISNEVEIVETYEEDNKQPNLVVKKQQSVTRNNSNNYSESTDGQITTDYIEVREGDVVTYYLEVTNTGNETANNVVLTDPVPDGLTFVKNSATMSEALTQQGNTLVWNIPSLAPGESSRVQVQFKVVVPEIDEEKYWRNIAYASYDDSNIQTPSNEVVIGDPPVQPGPSETPTTPPATPAVNKTTTTKTTTTKTGVTQTGVSPQTGVTGGLSIFALTGIAASMTLLDMTRRKRKQKNKSDEKHDEN